MHPGYWANAGKAFLRHSWSTPGFFRSVLTAGVHADLEPKARARHLFDVIPEAEGCPVELGTVAFRLSNLDPFEQYALAVIAQLLEPRRVFEIGTYDGASTLLLARNAPAAEIFTLDLPPARASRGSVAHEIENVARAGVGSRFAQRPEAERITQLLGDSTTFDFTPWASTVDLVLIDGGHDYVTAAADTATARALLAPGGVIVWDDYVVGWPGVVAAVDESGLEIERIADTGFAVHRAAFIEADPSRARVTATT